MSQFSKNKEYDLEERTAKFSESLIDFIKTIRQNLINKI